MYNLKERFLGNLQSCNLVVPCQSNNQTKKDPSVYRAKKMRKFLNLKGIFFSGKGKSGFFSQCCLLCRC